MVMNEPLWNCWNLKRIICQTLICLSIVMSLEGCGRVNVTIMSTNNFDHLRGVYEITETVSNYQYQHVNNDKAFIKYSSETTTWIIYKENKKLKIRAQFKATSPEDVPKDAWKTVFGDYETDDVSPDMNVECVEELPTTLAVVPVTTKLSVSTVVSVNTITMVTLTVLPPTNVDNSSGLPGLLQTRWFIYLISAVGAIIGVMCFIFVTCKCKAFMRKRKTFKSHSNSAKSDDVGRSEIRDLNETSTPNQANQEETISPSVELYAMPQRRGDPEDLVIHDNVMYSSFPAQSTPEVFGSQNDFIQSDDLVIQDNVMYGSCEGTKYDGSDDLVIQDNVMYGSCDNIMYASCS